MFAAMQREEQLIMEALVFSDCILAALGTAMGGLRHELVLSSDSDICE